MKVFVTFGPAQRAEWEEKVYNHMCIGVINAPDQKVLDEILLRHFQNKFATVHSEEEWNKMLKANPNLMKKRPRGYVHYNYTEC